MSVLPIVQWPDARLAQVCEMVGLADVKQLAGDMLDTMYAAPGRGLAGPQVGVLQAIFVMDCTWKDGDKDPMVFLDPAIIARSETTETAEEGCLSIPDLMVAVERPKRISLRWRNLEGQIQEADFSGFAARCIQHEIDHLHGRVTLDHLSGEERAEILQGYPAP